MKTILLRGTTAIAAACQSAAFQHHSAGLRPPCLVSSPSSLVVPRMAINNNEVPLSPVSIPPSPRRRASVSMMAGGFFSGLFGDDAAYAATPTVAGGGKDVKVNAGKGPTNEVVKTVNGMRQRRLGGSDIVVSELGLGTQRW